ncbi:MAG: AAA family ATPase [Roseburia faecis]|uniref:AAA family ATPase n=1 Tax=Roseburia faecis TaxID=301302 RepID=UPI0018997387|nr:AAA family ATPase [Roseburia faecis]MDY6281336.1 AAA family ATPase [Roseburia faecis]
MKTISIGKQDFASLREHNCFYIDKTDFIKEWWDSQDDVTLITRPRRFGKTLNMSMVECFFSVKYAKRLDLFEGLSIEKNAGLRKLQGTYPVLFLSFAAVKTNTYVNARRQICSLIASLYDENMYLLNGDTLNEREKKRFQAVTPEMNDADAVMALQNLCLFLSKYYGKKVIVLLDEYDTPLQESYAYGYWRELTAFTRSLFNATFKTNPYLERAIMTGITRVSKESIFSDLNNLEVITTTSEKYATSFGFTESEVFTALDEAGMSDQCDVVKKWYDGFVFGGKKDIYNPWSITNFLDKRKIDIYWANTSSNSLIGHLIQRGNSAIKEAMEDLLSGKELVTEIDEQIVFDQLDDNMTAIWSLLLSSGYLKINQAPKDAAASNQNYHLSLTNHEVDVMFRRMIDGWFKKYTPNYNAFVKALLADDVRAMNHYINRIALETFSFFDTGKGPSASAEPERFYHGFVLGLMVDLQDNYHITSNRESGFGRYDIMLEPVEIGQSDAIILEFKVIDPESEADLNATVNNALEQIRHKQYDAQLLARGFRPDQIRAYGFAFQGKQVLIGK